MDAVDGNEYRRLACYAVGANFVVLNAFPRDIVDGRVKPHELVEYLRGVNQARDVLPLWKPVADYAIQFRAPRLGDFRVLRDRNSVQVMAVAVVSWPAMNKVLVSSISAWRGRIFFVA